MCVKVCECLRCGRKEGCRGCQWRGAALGRMAKNKVDITASVMCVKGDGIQRCPGFVRGEVLRFDNKGIIAAVLPEQRN